MKKLSVYVHIPFCASKCAYCDFLSFDGMEGRYLEYVNALEKELLAASREFLEYEADTVFFGGGTPTVLNARELERVLEILRVHYGLRNGAEVTVEANPESAIYERLAVLRKAGANRLSIGVQSFDAALLKSVGRIHSPEQAVSAYKNARQAGFKNINLDLMFSLPEQSLADWEKTLDTAIKLSPEHLSCYGLTVEPATRLGKQGYAPDEELDREMYALTKEKLLNAGYEHYEISNFAKPGFRCRHNLVYWAGGEYRGFGLGAHSLTGGCRYHNACDLDEYIKAGGFGPRLEQEWLTKKDRMSEFMFLGLRLMDGINCEVFSDKFDQNIYEVYGDELESLAGQGLISDDGECVKLTALGIDVSNYVFSHFM